jgi:hypothetical protein
MTCWIDDSWICREICVRSIDCKISLCNQGTSTWVQAERIPHYLPGDSPTQVNSPEPATWLLGLGILFWCLFVGWRNGLRNRNSEKNE